MRSEIQQEMEKSISLCFLLLGRRVDIFICWTKRESNCFWCSKENSSWQWIGSIVWPLYWASWREQEPEKKPIKQVKSSKRSTSLILSEPQGTSSHKVVVDEETRPGQSHYCCHLGSGDNPVHYYQQCLCSEKTCTYYYYWRMMTITAPLHQSFKRKHRLGLNWS